MAQRIFLSYRRSDAAQRATFLKVVLQQKLHDVSVFVDRQSINPSERWPDRLTAALESSSAIVALIGPNWRFGPDGADRFQDQEDWVLRELEYGLEHKKGAFIPVLFETTTMSAYRDLPASLASMPAIQGHELGKHWEQDVDRLASVLARILGTATVGGTVKFPTPSELKKRAQLVTEAEFDDHKQAMRPGRVGIHICPYQHPRRRGRGHRDLAELHLHQLQACIHVHGQSRRDGRKPTSSPRLDQRLESCRCATAHVRRRPVGHVVRHRNGLRHARNRLGGDRRGQHRLAPPTTSLTGGRQASKIEVGGDPVTITDGRWNVRKHAPTSTPGRGRKKDGRDGKRTEHTGHHRSLTVTRKRDLSRDSSL